MKKLFLFLLLSSMLCADWEEHKKQTLSKLSSFEGWCSQKKASSLMDFIHKTHPILCVEIGTYGGSTTFPIAQTLSFEKKGKLFSIDAWNNHAATEGLSPQDIGYKFWSTADLHAVYNRCILTFRQKGLEPWCTFIKNRSEYEASSFTDESIDFLFIDGNFSATSSLQDVLLYYPKVKQGGYIWITHPMSRFKKQSIAYLMRNCTWLKDLSDLDEWIVFKKETEKSPSHTEETLSHNS